MSLAHRIMSPARQGDTIVEVMIAISIFAFVAVLSIAMMNSGVASAERSLELVTARNELNAQAEAIRFIHSSYAAELTLPICSDRTPEEVARGEKCQQFRGLWEAIVSRAIEYDDRDIPQPVEICSDIYREENQLLNDDKAFVLNTRQIFLADDNLMSSANQVLITSSATDAAGELIMQPAVLNARLVYVKNDAIYHDDNESDFDNNTTNDSTATVLQTTNPLLYRKVGRAEGIWVVAVKSQQKTGLANVPTFYDFYIQTCWYGSNSLSPTSLDAVIRLYNPEAKQ